MNPIDLSNKRYRVTKHLDFEILDAASKDSGIYYCLDKHKIKSFYYIEVVSHEPFRVLVKANQAKAKPLKDWEMKEFNLKLTTTWSKWTACSRCNKIGLRKRYGICTIEVSESFSF